MRRSVFVLFLILGFLSISAQNKKSKSVGNFSELYGLRQISVFIDFSETSLNGQTEQSLLNMSDAGFGNWREEKKEILFRFINKFAPYMSPLGITCIYEGDTETALIVKPSYVSNKGDVIAQAYVVDGSGKVLSSVALKGKGGHFGSFANLTGDGMEKVAEHLGSIITETMIKYNHNLKRSERRNR